MHKGFVPDDERLKNLYKSGNLPKDSTCANFAQVADNRKITPYISSTFHPPLLPCATKLDAFLQFNDAEILQNKGKVTAAIAKAFAESEFEQYRVIQDRLYQSDFDRLVASAEENN